MKQAERNPYATVAEAIRFVRSQARRQASLARIAEHVRLSPTHLQRTFSAWAGISPKRFLLFRSMPAAGCASRATCWPPASKPACPAPAGCTT